MQGLHDFRISRRDGWIENAANQAFRSAQGIENVASQLRRGLEMRPHGRELEARLDHLFAIHVASGDDRRVAALLEAEGDGENGMQVAQGASCRQQNALHNS